MHRRIGAIQTTIHTRVRSLALAVIYNLANLFLLALILRNFMIIRGDGPSGFGELILKGFMVQIGLLCFVGGVITSLKLLRKREGRLSTKAACFAAFLLLTLLSGIAVVEACTDDAGHCRGWEVSLT